MKLKNRIKNVYLLFVLVWFSFFLLKGIYNKCKYKMINAYVSQYTDNYIKALSIICELEQLFICFRTCSMKRSFLYTCRNPEMLASKQHT